SMTFGATSTTEPPGLSTNLLSSCGKSCPRSEPTPSKLPPCIRLVTVGPGADSTVILTNRLLAAVWQFTFGQKLARQCADTASLLGRGTTRLQCFPDPRFRTTMRYGLN